MVLYDKLDQDSIRLIRVQTRQANTPISCTMAAKLSKAKLVTKPSHIHGVKMSPHTRSSSMARNLSSVRTSFTRLKKSVDPIVSEVVLSLMTNGGLTTSASISRTILRRNVS